MRRIAAEWLVATLFLFLATISQNAAASQGRVALVVGNGAYENAPKLANPPNDANDVAAVLRELGWEVVAAVDVDRHGFAAAFETFLSKANGSEAALFYYAGHGVQYQDDNYLLPIDAKLDSAFSLKTDAISLKDVVNELETVSAVNLIFLDACRDNPLADKLSTALRSRGAGQLGRGLTRVAPSGANTLIAYSAAPGETAADGEGRNSPFTAAFLKNVKVSSSEFSVLFKSIVRDVVADTIGKQRPQLLSSMEVDFFFQTNLSINTDMPNSGAQTAYEEAAKVGTIPAYQAIIDSYPGTVQAKIATAAIESLKNAQTATQSATEGQNDDPQLVLQKTGTCRDEITLKSLKFDQKTSISFINSSNSHIHVYWKNYSGERILYGDLAPQQRLDIDTFVTHPWVITDESDHCIAVQFPDQSHIDRVVREGG
jgi:uncharacterized caspase-like protein